MDALRALLFAFAFGFFGSVPLTGPIAVLVLSKSIQEQYGAAVRIGLGAALAEGLYAGLANFFFHLVVQSPRLEGICEAVSAVLLFALGVYFSRWTFHESSVRKQKGKKALWTGFSISILNPTLLVTWTAVVATLASHVRESPSRLLAIPFGIGAALGVASWELLSVVAIRRYGEKFSNRFLKLLVRGVGVLLIALGVWAGIKAYRELHEASLRGRQAQVLQGEGLPIRRSQSAISS